MAILSKFFEDFANATGIPALGISRAVYSAAIVGYIVNVAIPALKKKSKAKIENVEHAPTKVDEAVHMQSSQKKTKSPAVNRYIFQCCQLCPFLYTLKSKLSILIILKCRAL